MLLSISKIDNLGAGKYLLTFNNGKSGTVDCTVLGNEEPAGVFNVLKQADFASKASLEHGTLTWPGELDVAPEYLYFLAFKAESDLQETFMAWGYRK
ncbi:MAG: hypothetical protein A2293_13870 [Elusimicrobia bacterium RIFOXYB2_FULL_49_7]|nr:MAG: hypothetical protein A2293_13870 [Elusimicrobia bacterium RIFOXYB2_FULL_49_7]